MSSIEQRATPKVATGPLSGLTGRGEPGDQEPPQLSSATIRLWKAFSPLSLERRRWALTAGAVEAFRAGDRFRVGGEAAVVVAGCLATEPAGSALAADVLGPGNVVGGGCGRVVEGQWITDGELYRVSLTDWLDKAGEEGLTHLLAAADARRTALERRVHCATAHRATARLADLFLAVHEAAPQPGIHLSQGRLGLMLGLRRTTVNGSCRALELAGASRTKRGQIRIIDARKLADVACGCRRAGAGADGEVATLPG